MPSGFDAEIRPRGKLAIPFSRQDECPASIDCPPSNKLCPMVKWQHLRRMLLHLAEHIAIALQNAEVYREVKQQMKFHVSSGTSGVRGSNLSPEQTGHQLQRSCHGLAQHHPEHVTGAMATLKEPGAHIVGALPQDLGPQSLLLMVTMHAPPGGLCRLTWNS